MTKAMDLADATDELLELTDGGARDIDTLLATKQPVIPSVPAGDVDITDELTIYKPTGNGGYARVTMEQVRDAITTVIDSEVHWQYGSEDVAGNTGTLKKLIIGEGLFVNKLSDETIEVFKPDLNDPAYLGVLNQEGSYVWGSVNDPLQESVFWAGSNEMIETPEVEADKQARMIQLSPVPGLPSSVYLLAWAVNMHGTAQKTGIVSLEILKSTKGDLITDRNSFVAVDTDGNPMAIGRLFVQGEKFSTLFLAGLVEVKETTAFRLHIFSELDQPIELESPLNGATAFVAQMVGHTDAALNKFTELTGTDIHYSTYNFANPIHEIAESVSDPLFKRTLKPAAPATRPSPKENYYTDNNIVVMAHIGEVDIGVAGDKLLMANARVNKGVSPFFTIAYYLPNAESRYFRGHTLDAVVEFESLDGIAGVYVMGYTGDVDGAADITQEMLTIKDTAVVAVSPWKIIGETSILKKKPSGKLSVVIPQDVNRIAVVLSPAASGDLYDWKVKEFTVNIDTPFQKAVIQKFLPKGESAYTFGARSAMRFVQGRYTYAAVRYTLNQTEKACPVGILKGEDTLGIELDTSLNPVQGSQLHKGEGVLLFRRYVYNGRISTTVRLLPGENLPRGRVATCYFTWYYASDDGSFAPVPNGDFQVTIVKGSAPILRTFNLETDITENSKLALRMRTDGDDWAYLQCDSEHVPLVEVVITGQNMK